MFSIQYSIINIQYQCQYQYQYSISISIFNTQYQYWIFCMYNSGRQRFLWQLRSPRQFLTTAVAKAILLTTQVAKAIFGPASDSGEPGSLGWGTPAGSWQLTVGSWQLATGSQGSRGNRASRAHGHSPLRNWVRTLLGKPS